MVHLWTEKQSLQWVPTFRPTNLSALQNFAPFILVIASAADRPFPQADLVGVKRERVGCSLLTLSAAVLYAYSDGPTQLGVRNGE
jgi:hypothetical protein